MIIRAAHLGELSSIWSNANGEEPAPTHQELTLSPDIETETPTPDGQALLAEEKDVSTSSPSYV